MPAFAAAALQAAPRTSETCAMASPPRVELRQPGFGNLVAGPLPGRTSVREESNLYAEATGLRPAGLTACPTHGGRVTGVEPATAWITTRPITGLLTLSTPCRRRTCCLRCVKAALCQLS